MTENLLQKLEEKVMDLVTELEDLRKESYHLRLENTNLKTEKSNHAKKLQALISLMDALDVDDQPISSVDLEEREEPALSLA